MEAGAFHCARKEGRVGDWEEDMAFGSVREGTSGKGCLTKNIYSTNAV